MFRSRPESPSTADRATVFVQLEMLSGQSPFTCLGNPESQQTLEEQLEILDKSIGQREYENYNFPDKGHQDRIDRETAFRDKVIDELKKFGKAMDR